MPPAVNYFLTKKLGNDTLELILRLHNDKNVSPERYDHAIELFLTQYPDGTVRKRRRHIEGHNYPIQRKTTGKGNQLPSLDRISEILSKGEPIENIDLALISSSDEASSSESDEE